MSYVIGGIHLDCAVKIMESLNGLPELEEGFSEQNIGACGVGFEQYGAIQSLLGLDILAVAKPVICPSVQRVELAFGLQLADRVRQVGPGQRYFPQ